MDIRDRGSSGGRKRTRFGLALAVLTSLPAMACDLVKVFSHPTDVNFSVDRSELRAGEELTVRFHALKGGDGRRYWLGLVPESAPLEDHSGCAEIAPGTEQATLVASAEGPHEVRVYSDRRGPVLIVARSKVRVLP